VEHSDGKFIEGQETFPLRFLVKEIGVDGLKTFEHKGFIPLY